uniref:tRNA-specific adenosine deaminase 1 n=1 Tax=Sciurus vulgaris TaxID=55149 RepID=A0A8D2BA88_SCIVU
IWTPDEIAQLCYEHYGIRLPKQGKPEPNREWTLLAAVVKIQFPVYQPSDTPDKPVQVIKEVVSMGTGTKSIGQSKMRRSGDILNDSHSPSTCQLWSLGSAHTARKPCRALIGRCQNVLALPKGFGVQEPKIQQSGLLFEQSRCAVQAKRADSSSRLVPCGAAISWAAVPEQPLDVTANCFPQEQQRKESEVFRPGTA